MGQREDVQRSLMVEGGHGRDRVARRKVAEDVKTAVITGSVPLVKAAHEGSPERAAGFALDQATAASAVVLASGLRAPANGVEPTLVIENEASAWFESGAADETMAELQGAQTDAMAALCTCSGSPPDADGQTDQVVDPACPMCGDGPGETGYLTEVRAEFPKVSENRQGWRGRLANVERLLTTVDVAEYPEELDWPQLREALAELRAMIDEAGVE